MSAGEKSLKRSIIGGIVGCLGIVGLLGMSGCNDVDWSSVVDDVVNDGDFTSSDLVGTWSGTVTATTDSGSSTAQYDFTVDDDGSFTAGNGTTGTATISSSGRVVFSYTYNSLTTKLIGTMNSDKNKLTMTTSTYDGSTYAFSGTLTNSDSDDDDTDYVLSDMVGTWTGTITKAGTPQIYSFTVTSSGSMTVTSPSSASGSATISSGGTVVFTYTSGDYTITLEGKMDSDKNSIVMSDYTWTEDKTTSSTTCSGTMGKAD
jgi:hypothetical protein